MKKYLEKLIPHTLKNKLIASFLLFILFPFTVLNVYNFHNVEAVLRKNVSDQVYDQLDRMNRTLEDFMEMTFQSLILLRQDTLVLEVLETPNNHSLLDRYRLMKSKFESITNSFFLSSPPIYFTVLDMYENVYTSFQTKKTHNYYEILNEEWYEDLMDHTSFYRWVVTDKNYVHPDFSKSEYLLSLDAVIKNDSNQMVGITRISIDFSKWFDQILRDLPASQEFFVISESGEVIVQSHEESSLSDQTIQAIQSQTQKESYIDSKDHPFIINYNHIDSLGWTMVNRIPLDVMYDDVNIMKQQYYFTFSIIILIFVLFTLWIATRFTRPLKELQMKMADIIQGDLNTSIPEENYRGEILTLTQHFNQMVRELDLLIDQLKMEERQKEAIKFQMLLSQMNPHFLNNTLNTIKWIALRQKNNDIAKICVSLGKMLETSLNSEMEMIRLREEMDLLESYILIQNYRYKGKFELIYDYSNHLNEALVPKLSLQPLVENSIYHGFSTSHQGKIIIQVYDDGNYLFIKVKDDGVGVEEATKRKQAGSGIGLSNLKERLRLLFKGNSGFSLESSSSGTIVKLHFPLLMSTPYREGGNDVVDSSDR